MEKPAPELRIESQRSGKNGTLKILAILGDETLAAEKLDVLKPKARTDFAKRLCEGFPGLDRGQVDKLLMDLAKDAAKAPEPLTDAAEIDISRVVRPELFHTADVSGVTVPIPSGMGGAAISRWVCYLRWHGSGHRERRELSPCLEMPDSSNLWVHPIPGDPTPTMRPGWSSKARQAWLEGAAAPNPIAVFKAICERIAHFLGFSPERAAGYTLTLALWTMLSYCYMAWRSIPYLSIGGPLGSGKTTVFGVLGAMVFRPIQSSNMTAPCIFRTLHDQGGTLLMDEAERLRERTPDVGEVRSILLSGYKAGSPAYRLEKVGEKFQQVPFDVYGLKALASIANLPEALASRCIRIMMFRVGPESAKPRLRLEADRGIWPGIRDDLYATALEHGPTWLKLATESSACPPGLSGREIELWSPLFGLAAWLESLGMSKLTALLAEHADHVATESRDDAAPDTDETLLRIVADRVVVGTQDTLKAGDVLKRAKDLDPSAFGEWSPKGIGSSLGKYGIRTTRGHGNAGRTYAHVTLESLQRIQQTYRLDLGISNVSHVSQASQANGATASGDTSGTSGDTCDTSPGGAP